MQSPILIVALVILVVGVLGIGSLLIFRAAKPRYKSAETRKASEHAISRGKKAICPYCACSVTHFMGEKDKCSSCGRTIWALDGEYLSEAEYQIRVGLKELASFKVTREMFVDDQREFFDKYGYSSSANETVWRILTQLARKDHQWGAQAYTQMARIADREERDFSSYLLAAHRNKLLDLKSKGIQRVVIVHGINANGDSAVCCEACRALHGKAFDIDEALRDLPLPKQCTSYHVCSCDYVREESWQRAAKHSV